MSRLSPVLPENSIGVKRTSLLCVSDFIYWLSKNKPDVFAEAMKAVGKDCKKAFNDLDEYVELWRK